jgi:hypothetical protein
MQPLLQLERRQHRPLGVVLVGHRHTKDGQEAIARHGLDGATILAHRAPGQVIQHAHEAV